MIKQHLFGGLMISALMLLAAGCSNEELLSASGDSVEINVKSTAETIGGNTSRATLANDTKTPNWEAGDTIAVIVDNGSASELSLTSGAGTVSGTFKGKIPSEGTNMYFYYPASAASGNVVDLTTQDGSNAKEMVMFASADYSTEPSIEFQNKTSILKLNIPVPAESGWNESTKDLYAIVMGAYSKGKLSKDGTWSDLEDASVKVSNIKVSDGMLTGYVAVIPGTNVTDLRIAVACGTKAYVTYNYSNSSSTVPENKVVTVNREMKKALLWTPGQTKQSDVTSFLGTDGTDLTIVAASEMGKDDFTNELRGALINGGYSDCTINLTLMNQNALTYAGVADCKTLKSVYAPDVTTIDKYCFKNSPNVIDVSLPKLKAFEEQIHYNQNNLQRACYASLTDFTKAKTVFSCSLELALGATEEFTFNSGENPLVLFRDKNTNLAANTTLYLNETGYEYKNKVSGNTWRGVTFKAIKKYSEFTQRSNGNNPPSMGYVEE